MMIKLYSNLRCLAIVAALAFGGGAAFCSEISVMTFNTMCDFCHKEEADIFSVRKEHVRATIEHHQSDLIGLQEVRLGSQALELFKNLPQYKVFFTDTALMSYADPAIAVNLEKFEPLENGNFWLGPNKGAFSLGWKFALPRQALWVKVRRKTDNREMVFLTSHFDNRVENLLGGAEMIRDFVQKQDLPVIFAADTNCVPKFEGYSIISSANLINAFDVKESFTIVGDAQEGPDLCYRRKGKKFPACRVDHVFLSAGHSWKVLEWIIDATKFGPDERFASDHRAVVGRVRLD